ncbi:hypothetical protein P4234_16440 [Pseudomonas aeruginosa]|nr:hypothetical protein [Pseudomonas aeruginosa]
MCAWLNHSVSPLSGWRTIAWRTWRVFRRWSSSQVHWVPVCRQ